MRWIGGGLRRPPRKRSTSSERLRFQRQRAWNIGESRIACSQRVRRPSRLVHVARAPPRAGSCGAGPSDSTIASSLAAACSSKLNVRQNFLRSARPRRAVDAAAVRASAPRAACRRCRRRTARARGAAGVGIDAEHRAADREVVDDHRRGVGVDPGGVDQPAARAPSGSPPREELVDAARAASTPPPTARRCAPAPRPARTGPSAARRRRRATRTTPGLDPADLPRVRAEQEDVARHRLDGPVLVDGADEACRRARRRTR